MTVTAKASRKVISGAGWVNPLTHDIMIENAAHVEVWADSTQLVLGVDYLVNDVLVEAGYEVEIVNPGDWAPTAWVLEHRPPINQNANTSLGGQFGLAYEAAMDAIIRRMQALEDRVNRAVVTSRNLAVLTPQLVMPLATAGTAIGWDADALALENKAIFPPISGEVLPLVQDTFLQRNADNSAFVTRTIDQMLSSLVSGSYTPNFTDAAPIALKTILEKEVMPQMFGAAAGAAVSQHVELQAMLDSGATSFYLTPGLWRCDQDITCTHDIILRGPGVLDFSNGTGQLVITGTLEQVSELAANPVRGGTTLTFVSAAALNPFELLCIYNPTDYSWSGHRSYYREGEMLRIHSKSGNVVTVYGTITDPYVAANVDVYRINGVRVDIDEITIISSAGTNKGPIKIDLADGVRIGSIKGSRGILEVFEVTRSYGVYIAGPTVMNNSAVVGDEYGVVIANCTGFMINTAVSNATRHPVALGGYDIVCAIPNRFGRIHNALLLNGYVTGAGDAHGNCDFIEYANVTANNQFVFGGRNMSWDGVLAFGENSTDGMCMYGSEIVGGFYNIRGTFVSQGIGTTSAYLQMTALGPTNTPTGVEGLRDDLFVTLDALLDVTGGASAKAFSYDHRGNAKKATFHIKNVDVKRAASMQCACLIRDTVTTPMASNGIRIDRVAGPSGMGQLVATASITAVPTKEMRQSGFVDVECTSAGFQAVAAAQTIRHPYSRLPNCQVSHGSTDGAAKSTWGGRNVAGYAHAFTASTIRPAAQTTAETAFTSTENVRLFWQTSVDAV